MKGTPTRETTSLALKIACRLRGLTQEEVAREVGLDETAFSRIVSGERVPSVLLALKIAETLHCTVEDLFHVTSGLRWPAGHRPGPERPRKTPQTL